MLAVIPLCNVCSKAANCDAGAASSCWFLLVSGQDAVDEDVRQRCHRRHVGWWKHSVEAVARFGLGLSHELVFVISAMRQSCVIRLVGRRLKGLAFYKKNEQMECVLLVAKRSCFIPDYVTSK